MKSIKMNLVASLARMRNLPAPDYPPNAEELAARIERFKARKRVLTASSADTIWSKAAEVHFEAGGVPRFAEHEEGTGKKPNI